MGTVSETRRAQRKPVITPGEIKARRTELGMSQRSLAVAADCSLTTIASIEHGVTKTGYAIERVAEILKEAA